MKFVSVLVILFLSMNIFKCLLEAKNLKRQSLIYTEDHSVSRELTEEQDNSGIINEVNSGEKQKSGSGEQIPEKTPEQLEQERLEEEKRQRIEELKKKQAELVTASERAQIQQKLNQRIEQEAFQEQLQSQFNINFQPNLHDANPIKQEINIISTDENSQIRLEEKSVNNMLPEETLQNQEFNYVLSNYQWYKNEQDQNVYVALPISWQVFIQDEYPQSKLIYKLGIQQNFDEEYLTGFEFANYDSYVDTSNVESPHSKFCSIENISSYMDDSSSQPFLFGLVSQKSFSDNLQVGEIFTQITQEQSTFLSAEFFLNYQNLITILLFVLKVQMGISGLDSSNICNPNFIESISDQIENELKIVSGESEDKIEIQYSECKEATQYQENPHITDIFDIQHLLIPIDQNSDVKSGQLILQYLKDIRFDYAIFFQNISEAPILQHLITYDIQKNYKILQLKKLFYNEKSIKNIQSTLQQQSEILQSIETAKQNEADELNEKFKELFEDEQLQKQKQNEQTNPEQKDGELIEERVLQNSDEDELVQKQQPLAENTDIKTYNKDSQEVLVKLQEIQTNEQKFAENLQHFELEESFMGYFTKQLELLESNESTIENIKTKKIFEKEPHQKVKLIQLVQIVENFFKYAKQFVFPDFEKEKCYQMLELKNQKLDCPEPLALCNLKFLQDLGKKNIDHSLFYDLFNFKFDKEVDLSKYFEIMHLYLLKLYQCSFIQQRAQKEFEERPLYEREQNHKNLGLKQKNYFDNVFSIDNIYDTATIKYATEINLDVKDLEKILI